MLPYYQFIVVIGFRIISVPLAMLGARLSRGTAVMQKSLQARFYRRAPAACALQLSTHASVIDGKINHKLTQLGLKYFYFFLLLVLIRHCKAFDR